VAVAALTVTVSRSPSFEAAMGMRLLYVAGVQTCALPIYSFIAELAMPAVKVIVSAVPNATGVPDLFVTVGAVTGLVELDAPEKEIGRASCRGRGEVPEGAVAVKVNV